MTGLVLAAAEAGVPGVLVDLLLGLLLVAVFGLARHG